MPSSDPQPAMVSYSGPSTKTLRPAYGPLMGVKSRTPWEQATVQPIQQPS